jgi:hypothetical protein
MRVNTEMSVYLWSKGSRTEAIETASVAGQGCSRGGRELDVDCRMDA